MCWRSKLALLICLISIVETGDCARILGICPRASFSHQIVFRGLTLALHAQGHELVVATTDPINDQTMKNYREIDISFLYNSHYASSHNINNWIEFCEQYLFAMVNMETEQILDHPELKELYAPNSNEKFDLILLELMYWPALLPFGKRFDAPIIGLVPMGMPLGVQFNFGNHILTSHLSNWELFTSISEPFSFWQRVNNFVDCWKFIHFYKTVHEPSQQLIAKKYFGDDVPDVGELQKNVSLVFVNQQLPISHVRPNVPKVVEINSFHVSWPVSPLPKDLQTILDKATEGVVYMSFGSNLKSAMLPNKTLNEIITAFSKLPYTVLWKFENDHLPGKPENVHIMKWIPQKGVLAHPNIKVFLYQGGLQSTEEAISYAVPLIGFPTWADQRTQVDKLVSLGVARKLDITTVNSDDILEAINITTLDNTYKKNMLKLQTLVKKNSEKLFNNAIWWTEHVIEHKGAPYLQSSTAYVPWYQRQDIDVIVFLSVGSTIFLSLTIFILYQICIVFISVGIKILNGKKKYE